MMLFVYSLFLLNLQYCSSNIAQDLHGGAYELLKGAIDGATEVIGTPVDSKEVLFFLHTKRNVYANHSVDPLNPAEMATMNGKIFFLIHGWTQSREKTPWFKPLTEIIFKKYQDPHVVQIDWGKAAANNYPFAAFTTESVGKIVGNVIYKLVKEYNVPLENIVIIGHSLGGQVSGWAGKRFQELTSSKLHRIIALDPAGPLFSLRPKEKRLNADDADFVMVVHTDGGKLGYGDSCGTIDFFPNGGSDQPGCYQVDIAKVSTFADPIWCDHRRGYDLFVEAVRAPESFMAKKCAKYDDFKTDKCENDAVSLGDLETIKSGTFYLDTGDVAPFIKKGNIGRNYTTFSGQNQQQEGNTRGSEPKQTQHTSNVAEEDFISDSTHRSGEANADTDSADGDGSNLRLRDEDVNDRIKRPYEFSDQSDKRKHTTIKILQDNYDKIKDRVFIKL